MTTQRQIISQLIKQAYEEQGRQMAAIIEQLITDGQNEEKVKMETRINDLENQVRSLISELLQEKNNYSELKKMYLDKESDTQKMKLEMMELQKQLENQKEAQQKLQADIVQMQMEERSQRKALKQELDQQKKAQVDMTQLQADLEAIKAAQPDMEKFRKEITEQVLKVRSLIA